MALKCTADTNVVAIASSNEMSDNMIDLSIPSHRFRTVSILNINLNLYMFNAPYNYFIISLISQM